MKAIRIELYQQLPNYRKPSSFLVKESYPIAPYSTVMGMIHAVCDYKETHDMKICVQGNHASETSDLAALYNFGIKYDPTRHFAKVRNSKGEYDGINRGVRSVHLLTDVYTTIYIVPDENDYDTVLEGLRNPKNYPSLGRYEDITRIDKIEEVELEVLSDVEEEDLEDSPNLLPQDMYIPTEQISNMGSGSVYKLRKKYSLADKGKTRQWDNLTEVRHVQSIKVPELKKEVCWFDTINKQIVCLA